MAFIITGKTKDGHRIVRDLTGQRFMSDEQIETEAAAQDKIAAHATTTATEMRHALARARDTE